MPYKFVHPIRAYQRVTSESQLVICQKKKMLLFKMLPDSAMYYFKKYNKIKPGQGGQMSAARRPRPAGRTNRAGPRGRRATVLPVGPTDPSH